MTYEKIFTTVTESTADDWLYANGMGRILNKKELRISLVRADDKELGLPTADDKLMNSYEKGTSEVVAYRLYYDDILVEPLRFARIRENGMLVPCPYFYSLSRFGGLDMTSLERAVGLALNPTVSKADYFGFMETIHMYVDDSARNKKIKEWMTK